MPTTLADESNSEFIYSKGQFSGRNCVGNFSFLEKSCRIKIVLEFEVAVFGAFYLKFELFEKLICSSF